MKYMQFMTKDKFYHLLAGGLISLIFGSIFILLFGGGVMLGFIFATLAGGVKEYAKDSGYLLKLWPSGPAWLVSKGSVEVADLAATSLGGLIGSLILFGVF